MSKKQPNEIPVPEKYIIKQKLLFTLSMTFLLAFALTLVVTVLVFVQETTFIGMLFIIADVVFGYTTLYILSRAQYDLELLRNSFRTMLILCILSFFALYPPLMMFFSRWAKQNLLVFLCLADSILIFANIVTLAITTLIMNKKAKKLLNNKKHRK